MKTRSKPRFRPNFEGVEDRCLMSVAVLEILNESKYNVGFDFRWSPSSAWSTYSEAPGQGEILSTSYSSGLAPQALFNPTTSPGNQSLVTLAQGYNEYNGTGTPPASAASLYEFQNTATGVNLFYIQPAPPPAPTDAVVSIANDSRYSVGFDFRWSPSSPWTLYTEAPGQSEIFWTTYSSGLEPQAYFEPTTSAGNGTLVTMAQGYGKWTGNGTPPSSAATPYGFETVTGGLQLFYLGGSAAPAPNPNAIMSPNWSGYVAATKLSSPQAGSVTEVVGSWIVPAVTGSASANTDSSVWVGIDGYGSGTVEQVGTQEALENGKPVYLAWWEMYSSGIGQPEQPIAAMTIEPGDSMTGVVEYMTSGAHAGQYYLYITNNSRANDSFGIYVTSAQYQSPLAQRSCAEWIVEAPTIPGQGIADLANFGSTTFSNASAVINGVSGPINSSSWQSTALEIGSSTVVQDITSNLTNSGTSFVVSYNNAAATESVAASSLLANSPSGTAPGSPSSPSPSSPSPSTPSPSVSSPQPSSPTPSQTLPKKALHKARVRILVRHFPKRADGGLKEHRLS
jgi:Peptidase A4 family